MRKRVASKPKKIRDVFLVLCEGKTEERYIELLRTHYHLPIAIKTKITGTKINKRLVDKYVDEVAAGDASACHVFYVYDMDVADITEKLKSLPGMAVLSNPCIEIWFLLHVKNHNAHIESADLVKALCEAHPDWKKYSKGMLSNAQQTFLFNNLDRACERAKKLNKGQNPSTNFYEFINSLDAARQG